jgi:hypothetical protein
MEIPARNGLNSPSRHLHAPDCHAAHRQIATIRCCAKRRRRGRPLSSAGHYLVLLDVGAQLVAVLEAGTVERCPTLFQAPQTGVVRMPFWVVRGREAPGVYPVQPASHRGGLIGQRGDPPA